MRIRIVKQAQGSTNGISLDRYHVGRVYDVSTMMADYLVAEGFAIVEMRGQEPESVKKELERRRRRH